MISARASVSLRFMPPDSVRIAARPLRREPRELEQPRDARVDRRAIELEIASVDDEVLGHREVGVEVVHLRHDADADARLARRLRHRLADHLDRAAVRDR